jgi:SAM-dependent methyltransferase
VTGQDLLPAPDGSLQTVDGGRCYRVADGIYDFLGALDEKEPTLREEKQVVKTFYETFGWERTKDGLYKDSVAFVALSPVARSYTERCNLRVRALFERGGRYFLDAGSGAIPWPEYMRFHERFDVRICADLSRAALLEAKRKLGDKGRYVLADLTRLPFKDGTVDGAVANHVFYHIPADEQPKAFSELARVLSPGSKGAVTYVWATAPLARALARVFRLIELVTGARRRVASAPAGGESRPKLYFHAHTSKWFRSRRWPFAYELRSFRLIDNYLMQRFFRDTWIWRGIVDGLLLFQAAFPRLAGKYGQYPLIVVTGPGGKTPDAPRS